MTQKVRVTKIAPSRRPKNLRSGLPWEVSRWSTTVLGFLLSRKKKHVVFFSGSFADRLVWICSTGCFMATDEELRALRLQDLSDPLAALLGDGDATTKATEESSGLNFSRIWRSIM